MRFWILLVMMCLLMISPAEALVKMDRQSIDLALKFGMQNQGLGLNNLLGANWMEGEDGVLLNIYTPFMMLAAKSYSGGFPEEPTTADIKKARDKYARLIRDFTDPKLPMQIKFSTSLYGDAPDFASHYTASVEGFGRGKHFVLKPVREIRQKVASQDPNGTTQSFEAINAYYFQFDEIAVLQEYQFVLDNHAGKRYTFNIRNDKLY